jgi:hypothetical protein
MWSSKSGCPASRPRRPSSREAYRDDPRYAATTRAADYCAVKKKSSPMKPAESTHVPASTSTSKNDLVI